MGADGGRDDPIGGAAGIVSDAHLRSAFAAVAGDVQVRPVSFAKVSSGWRRRYRRRRLVLAVLVALVFGLADLVGLWMLNNTESGPGVIFSDRGSTSQQHAPRPAWP